MGAKLTDEHLRQMIKLLRKSGQANRTNNRPGKRRFSLYDYITDVYAAYLQLESNGVAKKAARRIIKLLHLPIRKYSHPVRVLIEATAGPEDARQKSRWVQAVLYLLGWKTPPEKVKLYIRWGGGIAGCARKQAINTRGARHRAVDPTSNSGKSV